MGMDCVITGMYSIMDTYTYISICTSEYSYTDLSEINVRLGLIATSELAVPTHTHAHICTYILQVCIYTARITPTHTHTRYYQRSTGDRVVISTSKTLTSLITLTA